MQWFEQNLEVLNRTFYATLEERNTVTNKKIDEVHERITKVADRLTVEKAEILRQIEEQGIQLNRLLNEFKVHSYPILVLGIIACFQN